MIEILPGDSSGSGTRPSWKCGGAGQCAGRGGVVSGIEFWVGGWRVFDLGSWPTCPRIGWILYPPRCVPGLVGFVTASFLDWFQKMNRSVFLRLRGGSVVVVSCR